MLDTRGVPHLQLEAAVEPPPSKSLSSSRADVQISAPTLELHEYMEWTTLTNKLCTDPPWPCIWQPELQIYSREVKKSRGEVSSNLALPQNDIPIYAHLNHLGDNAFVNHWPLDVGRFSHLWRTNPTGVIFALLASGKPPHRIGARGAARGAGGAEPRAASDWASVSSNKNGNFHGENVHVNMCYMC